MAENIRVFDCDGHIIESIPTLGTGKVDLRAVRQLAADSAASSFSTVDA